VGIPQQALGFLGILVDILDRRSYTKNMMNLNLLKWLGTGFTVLGALLTSLEGWDPYNVAAFNLGAIFWLWAAIRMREASLITVNAVLLTIYVFGSIIRLT
jgi:hypothetical protein